MGLSRNGVYVRVRIMPPAQFFLAPGATRGNRLTAHRHAMSAPTAPPLKRIKALYIAVNALVFCFHLFRHAFMTTRLGFTAAQYGDAQV